MKTTLLVLACALGLVALATPVSAGWPCTCDPNPITDLASCVKDGPRCPITTTGLPEPVEQLVYDLTHCTCPLVL